MGAPAPARRSARVHVSSHAGQVSLGALLHAPPAPCSPRASPGCTWTTATWAWVATTAGAPRVRCRLPCLLACGMREGVGAAALLHWLLLCVQPSGRRLQTDAWPLFTHPLRPLCLQCMRNIWCRQPSTASPCSFSRWSRRAAAAIAAAAAWRWQSVRQPHGGRCCSLFFTLPSGAALVFFGPHCSSFQLHL